jgi:hypothetical protein
MLLELFYNSLPRLMPLSECHSPHEPGLQLFEHSPQVLALRVQYTPKSVPVPTCGDIYVVFIDDPVAMVFCSYALRANEIEVSKRLIQPLGLERLQPHSNFLAAW